MTLWKFMTAISSKNNVLFPPLASRINFRTIKILLKLLIFYLFQQHVKDKELLVQYVKHILPT